MIIYLYGEDTYRSRQKLKQLREKYRREVDAAGLSLAVLDGETASLAEIGGRLSPSSMFAKKRLVIIENIMLAKSAGLPADLLEFLQKSKGAADNIVIFWDQEVEEKSLAKSKLALFQFLEKQTYAQNFKFLSNTEIAAWIKKETEARGGKIALAAAAELASLAGSDLWQISNEIDKLIDYNLGQTVQIIAGGAAAEISREDVRELVRGHFDENIFALTDAIGSGRRPDGLRLLAEQREAGLADGYILAMITRQFRIILAVKDALEQGYSIRQIAGRLKLHPFVAQKGVSQARNFTLPALKRILNELIRLDFRVKTGRIGLGAGLDLFLARL